MRLVAGHVDVQPRHPLVTAGLERNGPLSAHVHGRFVTAAACGFWKLAWKGNDPAIPDGNGSTAYKRVDDRLHQRKRLRFSPRYTRDPSRGNGNHAELEEAPADHDGNRRTTDRLHPALGRERRHRRPIR